MKNRKHMLMRIAALAMIASLSFSTMTAFADWEQPEWDVWKYKNSDGTYVTSSWKWIDGKCYCFDPNGIMYKSTITPDGYKVNYHGAWTIDGIIQTNVNTPETSDPDQYPLAYLKDWFVFTDNGSLRTKWSRYFLWEQHPELENARNEKYGYVGTGDYVMTKAANDHNILYQTAADIGSEPIYAVGRLAGVQMPGYQAIENDARTLALEKEIRDFLNSFDWKNASDFEKAVRIARRVNQAEYDNTTDRCSLADGCLVDGKAVCSGFVNAANLLAWCVGLQSTCAFAPNHTYAVYCINGIWVSHEATSHDEPFHIMDPQKDIYMIGSYKKYGVLAEYCDRTGYTVPSNDVILSRLEGHARVIDNLGRIAVYFD